MRKYLRLLLIEDVPTEAQLAVREIVRHGIDCQWRRVDTESGLLRELDEFNPQVILSDFSFPQFDGWSALRLAQSHAPDVPFIFFSGTIGEDVAINSLRAGAMDYVLKHHPARLVPAVERAMQEMDARRERRRATQQLHDIIATSQDWIWEIDADHRVLFSSPSGSTILRRTADSVYGADFLSLVAEEDRGEVERCLSELRQDRPTVRFLARFDSDHSRPSWLETRALAQIDAQGVLTGIRGASRDVTEQQEQQERIHHLTRVLKMVSGVNGALVRLRDRDSLLTETCRLAITVGRYVSAIVWLVEGGDTIRSIFAAGSLATEFTGIQIGVTGVDDVDKSAVARAIRTQQATVVADIMDPTMPVMNRDTLRGAGVHGLVALPLIVDNTSVGALVLGSGTTNPLDERELEMLREVAANLSFALQYMQREDTVRFLSYFDALTGLAKRPLFCERLDRRLARRVGPEPRPAVVVFDLERLGLINDSAGRHIGDGLLQMIADRMRRQVAESDDLAHLGAGTFAVMLPMLGPAEHAGIRLHERVASLFSRPFEVDGHSIRAVARAGIARFPDDGSDAVSLLENAEAALKDAKSSGERFLPYRLQPHRGADGRLEMEQRLRAALEERQFVLHYQPKIDIGSRRLVGLEALIRWQDPARGLISPGEFLPVLEATQMIIEVGEWVLDQAVEDIGRWSRQGLSARVAVNVSPLQLRRRGFADQVLERLGSKANARHGLDLEITESALLQDPDDTIRKLSLLRSSAVGIAIDDFGTGYSSLARLSFLPVDTLKIDRSFTSGLPDNAVSTALVAAIISLARTFQLVTVAEGVETEPQFEALRALGCHQSQGYLHGKPQSFEDITCWLIVENARDRSLSPPAQSKLQGTGGSIL